MKKIFKIHYAFFTGGRSQQSLSFDSALYTFVAAVLSIPSNNWAAETVQPTLTPRVANYHNVPQFGGPGSVGSQMQSDDQVKKSPFHFKGLTRYLMPYYNFKSQVNQQIGLSFGSDYAMLFQGATETRDENYAAGGVWRFFGTWNLIGRGTAYNSSLVYKVENRHTFGTEIPPQDLASEIGYAGLTSVTFSDADWLLTNLYWLQTFNHNRIAFEAGIVDVTDYVDVYGFINPWTDFNNLAFSTSPTIPAPSQGMGVALNIMFTDQVYLLAGFADTNGDPANPGNNFETFFDDSEYFKHIELGWISSWKNRFQDNIHLTAWQTDQREKADVPSGWGLAFSFSKKIDERWLPFLRAGYSNGGGALLDYSVSAGLGYFVQERSDVIGFGFNWGQPSDQVYGADPKDQYTAELFYRIQLFQHTTITPDIQLLVNPALNPEASTSWVFSIRTRFSF